MICWYCLKDHKLAACETFISLNLKEKKNFVKEKQICWNYTGSVVRSDIS